MICIHIDDLQYHIPSGHFDFLKRWLEQNHAVIVQPDDVIIPNNFMPGTFTGRRGRWDQDEPYPPYGGTRKLFEAAKGRPPKA